MASKRSRVFVVNVRWHLPDGTSLTRHISEKALTPVSARKKVMAYYNQKGRVKKLASPHLLVSLVIVRVR